MPEEVKIFARIPDGKRAMLFHLTIIAAAVFICYSNALSSQFVYDDHQLIINNPFIRSWDNAGRIFMSGFWAGTGINLGMYRPLVVFSFLIEHSVFGFAPFFYHLDNLIIHISCSILVYFILKNIFEDDRPAFFSALIFAVHPVHTEAVTWVSGRTELLWAFFSLLSVLFFIKNYIKSRFGFVLISCAAFLLGLLSKETAAVAPALMAAYMLIFDKDLNRKNLVSSLWGRLYPYVLVFLAYFVSRFSVVGGLGIKSEYKVFGSTDPFHMFLYICHAFSNYIRLVFLPFDLTIKYDFPSQPGIFDVQVLFPILMVLLAAFYIKAKSRLSKPVAFAAACLFIPLLPVLNIIPTYDYILERAAYVPSLGACMIIGASLAAVTDGPFFKRPLKINYGIALLVAILLLFSVVTVLRNADWKDDFTLFGRLIKRSPNNPVGYLNYGENLFNQKRFSEALPYVEKGLGLSASSEDFKALAHLLLGNIYAESGNTNRAVQHYQEVIDNPSPNKPDYEAYCNLGLLYGKLGQLDKAREYLEKGVALNPYYAAGRRDLGVAYGMAGMTDKAIEQFRKALELDPDDKLALENLDYAVKLKEGN